MEDAAGEHVEEHARAMEQRGKELSNLVGNDEAHLDPSRWWFAASAFPMAAGTMGPVASAFSICALVRPWRQRIPPGSLITNAIFIDDPTWLTVINAIQVVVAIIANMFLLLNMTRRVRFAIAQPVTIIGWYLSALCLTALAATASGPLRPEMKDPGGYVWSQAFYYGVFAAALYFIVASLMVVTFLGAQAGRYDKDFQLTTSQRTLMLQTIMFLMYLLIGALVFSTIEGWQYLDAVYWADVTLFTVGFGDFAAQTPLGRALLLPYALVGVISLGLVIGSIRSLAIERGKRKLDARMMEKNRRRKIRQMTMKKDDNILVPIRDGDGADPNSPDKGPGSSDGAALTEFDRRGKEFELMRKIQHQAAVRRRWNAMAISTSTWLVLWLAGAAIFQNCEAPYQHWTYFDGVYFCFVSLTTIGYGDVTPISNSAKAFFVFWSMLALPTMTVLISNAGDTIVKGIRDGTNALGSITILPGERGLRKELKAFLRMLSCGNLYEESIEERPPGFLGAAQPSEAESATSSDDEQEEFTEATKEKLEGAPDDTTKQEDGTSGATKAPSSGDSRAGFVTDKETAEPLTSSPVKLSHTDTSGSVSDLRGLPRLQKSSTTRTSQSAQSAQTTQTVPKPRLTRRASSLPRSDFPTQLPASRAAYHVLLIDEIARVTQHLRASPPRKYTFAEWAWYLRLIGEDEANAETHRRVQPHVHHRHTRRSHRGKQRQQQQPQQQQQEEQQQQQQHRAATLPPAVADDDENDGAAAGPGTGSGGNDTKDRPPRDEEDQLQWSWVGARSPLMGSQEEAEWILEKLTMRLQEELKMVDREEKEAERRKSGKGKTHHHHVEKAESAKDEPAS